MTVSTTPGNLVEKANRYIEKQKETVIQQYRNQYHVMAPVGWINDPNGFVYYKGEYHLFYQFYPYDSAWGPMHWGHAKSTDLIHWEDLPVALAPDQPYDQSGCFSGSAIVKDDALYLMYTGHVEKEGKTYQTQCMAVSTDGIHFEKLPQNPVISEKELGEHGSKHDFRDPKVMSHGGRYYSVIATKSTEDRGRILLFESENLVTWTFKSILLEGTKEQGIMWECPDLFHLDGHDVLIMSPIQWQTQDIAYTNISSTVAFIGEVDWDNGTFSVANYHEIDSGMDFYAPQTCEGPNSRRVMIAWMQMWDRTLPTHDLGHHWAGSMTLPRELHVSENRLIQEPVHEVYEHVTSDHYLEKVTVTADESLHLEDVIKDQSYVKLVITVKDVKNLSIALAPKTSQPLLLTYDHSLQRFQFTREHVGHLLEGNEPGCYVSRQVAVVPTDDQLTIELFKDTSSIETFIGHRAVMTNTFYAIDQLTDFIISVEGTAVIETLQIGGIR